MKIDNDDGFYPDAIGRMYGTNNPQEEFISNQIANEVMNDESKSEEKNNNIFQKSNKKNDD